MPFNVQQQAVEKKEQDQSSFRKSVRKAPGTRIGIMTDWREGSAKSGKLSDRYGRSFRDGR